MLGEIRAHCRLVPVDRYRCSKPHDNLYIGQAVTPAQQESLSSIGPIAFDAFATARISRMVRYTLFALRDMRACIWRNNRRLRVCRQAVR